MHYFPKTLKYHILACTVAEQIVFSKSKSKKRTIPCLRLAHHPVVDQKTMENTCVQGLTDTIITARAAYLKFESLDGYVETNLIEYAKCTKWCLEKSVNPYDVKWILTGSDQKVVAMLFDEKSMEFVPDIQEQALTDELLIASSSKERCLYAWKFGEAEDDATFWERNLEVSNTTNIVQISPSRYLPCTQLDLESKARLSQAAKMSKHIVRVARRYGLSLQSGLLNSIETNYPFLSFNAMLSPKGTSFTDLVFLANKHRRSHFNVQAHANPLYEGEVPSMTNRSMYYLPISKWEEIHCQIENELHPDYQDIWGLPKYFGADVLLAEGTEFKDAQLEITSMPVIENKIITRYTVSIKWHRHTPNFKSFNLPEHTRKKNKLTFFVNNAQEVQQLIKKHLMSMCSHLKCAITYKDIKEQNVIPWLSYTRDVYESFAEITLEQKTLGDVIEDDDIDF